MCSFIDKNAVVVATAVIMFLCLSRSACYLFCWKSCRGCCYWSMRQLRGWAHLLAGLLEPRPDKKLQYGQLKGKLKNAMKTTKTAAKKNKISVPTADELWSIAIPSLKWKARPSQTASNMFQANASNQLTSTDISNCNNWISLTDAERLVQLQQLRQTMSQKQW